MRARPTSLPGNLACSHLKPASSVFVFEVAAQTGRPRYWVSSQLVSHFGEDGAGEVHALLSGSDSTISVFPVSGSISSRAARSMSGPLLVDQVGPLAVFLKAERCHTLKDVAGIDLGKFVGVDAQDLGVAVLRGTFGQRRLPFRSKIQPAMRSVFLRTSVFSPVEIFSL